MKKRDREENAFDVLGDAVKIPKLSDGPVAPQSTKDRISLLREQLAAKKKEIEVLLAVTGSFYV